MQDPYEILGVSRDASMDEIKKAYRTLSRKYHPDANINNPNKDKAEEKFKQIQQAYQQIVDEKEHPERAGQTGQRAYRQGGYTQDTYNQQTQDQYYDPFAEFFGYGYRRKQQTKTDFGGDPQFRAAANYINNGYYKEAMNVLENMTNKNTGNWYYLHAIAHAGLGNNVSALEDARKALQLEPNNPDFKQLLAQLQSGSGWYGRQGENYGTNCGGSNACLYFLPCCCCCGASNFCHPCCWCI
jgi:molecular chaperone DnaJ